MIHSLHLVSGVNKINRHSKKFSIITAFIALAICYFPVYGENTSEPMHPNKIIPGIPMNNSYPVDLNITINTTGYSIENAVDENKKRINFLLSSMLDPDKGNMNLSDIEVVQHPISHINPKNTSLEKIYQNNSVYLASSTVRINTTLLDQKHLFRDTMPTLLGDQTLVKASYLATYEK